MKTTFLLLTAAAFTISAVSAPAQTAKRPSSRLAVEPGTIHVEDILPKAIFMKVMQDSPIYATSKLDRATGSMAPGTIVKLVGMSDTGFRVRGKARHGDTSGWLPAAAVAHPDPNLVTNLKKLHERQTKVEALIVAHQIALGMTGDEVAASMGKPTRKSSKLSAGGKEEKLEYVIYERVPQYNTSVDAFGRAFQTVTYIKVETGSLAVNLKDNVVDTIEETKGNPLGSGGVQIIPGPMVFGF
ncbi:hypothetical protein [Brevifollis gellanilyticus]|uniref:SH3b domain-containing protein n=1 Tax=Brevifollis gellanilyticus TaxID=748831 RepID=A0A512M232_9BACT|nr:hypothetical protein [Brevifollis gellanilyticus]GEP40789.1 hypothetical protein BGE01nite_00800 [Brevifollis gellanilyticus]